MKENKDVDDIIIESARGYFDGMKFLWKTPAIRYYLKFIVIIISIVLFVLTIENFMWYGLEIYEDNPYFFYYVILDSVIFFFLFFGPLYFTTELTYFYWNAKKFRLFPEKNIFLKKNINPSISSDQPKKLRIFRYFILLGYGILSFLFTIIFNYELVDMLFLDFYGYFITYTCMMMMGILAFYSTKGLMQSFENKFSKNYRRSICIFLILFLLSFFLFRFLSDYYDLYYNFCVKIGFDLYFATIYFISLYFFLIGICTFWKRDLRLGYINSFIFTYLTVLFIMIIPFFISIVLNVMGIVVLFFFLIFFFIQGVLDKRGDDLRSYYNEFEEYIKNINVNSEKDMPTQTFEKKFSSTPLFTSFPNALPNVILSLIMLTYIICTIFIVAIYNFLWSEEVELIESYIVLHSFSEYVGISVGIAISIILIIRHHAKKIWFLLFTIPFYFLMVIFFIIPLVLSMF